MNVAGLFAGIGGIELGFERAGFRTSLLCEIDPCAVAVLRKHFPETPIACDIRRIEELPRDVDVVTAGFPCQDLSQAGRTEGIGGARSGLVREVFRLLDRRPVPWVVVENVSFMLRLDRGSAMRLLADEFERRGYRWAYRMLDSRAFGLPQRRERVYFVASREVDPSLLLFGANAVPREPLDHAGFACGFYWTEGLRGLGWGVDCVPTLKGGSSIGIPSPPAIWLPSGDIVTPDIRDAERLQGFEADWTVPAESVGRRGSRWRLVGNAVSVDAAAWIAQVLKSKARTAPARTSAFDSRKAWPPAAFGGPDGRLAVDASAWPVARIRPRLDEFLQFPWQPLSSRATRGFVTRLRSGSLRRPTEFDLALDRHLERLGNYPMAQRGLPGVSAREAA
jgi:DNA (cytosine-5)-methyltransferase 1